MITLIPVLIVALFLILVVLTAHSNVSAAGAGGQTEELRSLRRRIKVLERIVVDQDRQLRRDIDGLS